MYLAKGQTQLLAPFLPALDQLLLQDREQSVGEPRTHVALPLNIRDLHAWALLSQETFKQNQHERSDGEVLAEVL